MTRRFIVFLCGIAGMLSGGNPASGAEMRRKICIFPVAVYILYRSIIREKCFMGLDYVLIKELVLRMLTVPAASSRTSRYQ